MLIPDKSGGTPHTVIWTVHGVQHDRLQYIGWPEVQCSWDCMCHRPPELNHREIPK